LDTLMAARSVPPRLTQIAPEQIITRRSTESFAVSDPALVKALHFIGSNAGNPIQVQDVARAAAVSRRVLERRFIETLQRSPADEIRRVHMEMATRLLAETNLPIPEVAEAAGFTSPEYLAYVFKRETGKSPLEYRKALRRT